MKHIPGILILNDNRTYGRHKTNNRLLYRCIPNDKTLSPVLIPYNIKIGFSKVLKNLYILFSIKDKTSTLVETIGEIDILENFYEYQLYCRNLKHKHPSFSLQPVPQLKREKIQPFIFTIDSPGTIDFDDAFSIETLDIYIKITIYISNVPFMLTKHNLWQHFHFFQERVSSIYLPNKKIPLFPTKLSELCSLSSGQERHSFVFSLYIHKNTNQICHHDFQCEDITISTNYIYEATELLSNANYVQLLQTVQTTFNKNIQTSAELVETLMIFMGEKCAEQMDNGIYLLQTEPTTIEPTTIEPTTIEPTTTEPTTIEPTTIEPTTIEPTTIEPTTTQKYKSYNSLYVLEKHENSYMHITSPIRRIVDIVNMTQLIINIESERSMPSSFSLEIQKYICNVKQNVIQLNSTMKSIKKTQSQCRLYYLFKKQPINKLYNGILFDKRETKTPDIYSYSVYLTEYKFTTTIKTRKQETGEHRFHLHLFHDATTLKQKIKLQIVDLC
jgi:exoribonuclease R